MIGYSIVGTSDLRRSEAFYDPLFARMGLETCYGDDFVRSWGIKDDHDVPRFFVCYPFNEEPASVGNGSMTAFRVKTASDVAWLHAQAMKTGATDEGGPGFRPETYGDRFYVAYIRDPDGNKIAFCCYDGKENP